MKKSDGVYAGGRKIVLKVVKNQENCQEQKNHHVGRGPTL
jgi:hypothetical protein